jgi:DNA-binding MarR family transcriptional regulator
MEAAGEISLEQPMELEGTGLNEEFVKNLILKVIGKFAPSVKEITDITGLSQSVIEPILRKLEDEKFISFEGISGMTAYLTAVALTKGRDYIKEISKFDNYLGIAPVPYKQYREIIPKITQSRHPINIPQKKIEDALDDLITSERTREPILMPRGIEYGGKVIALFDPDFHVPLPQEEQPKDQRWIKVEAPFVFTGPELKTEKLNANYDPERGAYVAQPQLKAHGGVFLVDDLGRQIESHHIILNRLIFPMENKKDLIYVGGIPIEVFTDFVPILSTNISIAIFDEAHLEGIETPSETLQEMKKVFKPKKDGGLGLTPSYAVLQSTSQLIQMLCASKGLKSVSTDILYEAIDKNIVMALQKQDVVLRRLDNKFKNEISSFELHVQGDEKEIEKSLKLVQGVKSYSLSKGIILVDLVEGTSPVELVTLLETAGVKVEKIIPLGKTQAPIVDEELLGG